MYFHSRVENSADLDLHRINPGSAGPGLKHHNNFGNWSKISNTFLSLNKMLVIRAGINITLVRLANRDPWSEHCLSGPFW